MLVKGGMFNYVSGANFFGEIVEWTGFAVACWSVPAAAFAMFTACFIGPRAVNHHRFTVLLFIIQCISVVLDFGMDNGVLLFNDIRHPV
jgi:3-oxo-5-alpha-steroid 4-dehydrogenase